MGDLNGGYCSAYKTASMDTFEELMSIELGVTPKEAEIFLDHLNVGSASYGMYASGLNSIKLLITSPLLLLMSYI